MSTESSIREAARRFFTHAGGDPDNSGPLAEWGLSAWRGNDTRIGVIVGEDGAIVAHTRHADGFGAGSWYVTDVNVAAEVTRTQLGMAMGELRSAAGQEVAHAGFHDLVTNLASSPSWTVDEVAQYLGIQPRSVHRAVDRGSLPRPDGHTGRTPWWRPETIRAARPVDASAAGEDAGGVR